MNLLTEQEIYLNALKYLGITKIEKEEGDYVRTSVVFGLSIKKIQKELEKAGFVLARGTGDKHRENMMYLSHPDIKDSGRDIFLVSNWSWKIYNDPEFMAEVRLILHITEHHRGIMIQPVIYSATHGSPLYQPVIDELFKVIASSVDTDHQNLIADIAQHNCRYVLGWHRLNLGGLRSLSTLFKEWANSSGKETIVDLAKSSVSPFDPNPYKDNHKRVYIEEKHQADLFTQWDEQLNAYVRNLTATVIGVIH